MKFTTYGTMEFRVKMRTLMKLNRISQDELGEMMGLSQGQISKWVRGKSKPDIHESALIAKVLKVSLDYLADDSREESPEAALMEFEPLKMMRDLGPEVARLRLMKAPSDNPEGGYPGKRVGHQIDPPDEPGRRKGSG